MTNKYLGVDPMLTSVAIAYTNGSYIADKIFLPFPVKKQSGKHFVYDRGRFRVNDTRRSTGSNSNEVTLKLTTGGTYYAEDHVLKQFVADEDVDNAITPTDPYMDATENTTDMLMVDREKSLADYMASTTNLTQNTTLAGTDQWSDFNNSDPFDDIETGKSAIKSSVFIKPNTLILGQQVYDKLKHHPDLLERVKYSQKGVITIDLLKELFEVDNVLIGDSGYNSATEGQTDSMSYIWGKHAWLAYINPQFRGKALTFGVHYTWKQMQVERLRGSDEEDRKGTYIRVGNYYYDQLAVSVECAYLIKNAVA